MKNFIGIMLFTMLVFLASCKDDHKTVEKAPKSSPSQFHYLNAGIRSLSLTIFDSNDRALILKSDVVVGEVGCDDYAKIYRLCLRSASLGLFIYVPIKERFEIGEQWEHLENTFTILSVLNRPHENNSIYLISQESTKSKSLNIFTFDEDRGLVGIYFDAEMGECNSCISTALDNAFILYDGAVGYGASTK